MKTELNKSQLNCEISEKLHRGIKAAAALDGVSLVDWVAAALEDKMRFNSESGRQLANKTLGKASKP